MGGLISPFIQSIFWAWLLAHLIKYILTCIENKTLRITRKAFDSGGMPSAHTATVTSLAFTIGMIDGFNSAIFALSFIFLLVVMHDAIRVRRSTGEQGIAINRIIKRLAIDIDFPHFSKGHTPKEVAVGFALGIAVGLIVFLATK